MTDSVLRVLGVDDDPVCRQLILKTIHKFHSVQIDTAVDGIQAIEMAGAAFSRHAPYQLLFLDCHMPGFKGPEVLSMIRRYERERELAPCYACIISSDDECKSLFPDLNSNVSFLVKPVRLEHVLRTFRLIQKKVSYESRTSENFIC